jgi:CubicO group peptidase (beta-lactamase class C family)
MRSFTNILRQLTVSVLFTVVVISCSSNTIDDIKSADPQFNIATFEAKLLNDIGILSVGFSYVISLDGQWQRKGGIGMAQTSADRNFGMTENTHMNIASISKFITTIAALRIIESDPQIDLDDAMGPYLPNDWNPTNDVQNITFRQLMSHKSGLHINVNDGEDGQLYDNLKDVVQNTPVGSKTYDYVNINFAFFRILIPNMIGAGNLNNELDYAIAYENYIQSQILNAIGISGANLLQDDLDALLYSFPDDNSSGADPGDWTLISGAGGWYMSAFQLAHFIAFVWHSEDLISEEMKNQMNNSLLGLSESTDNGDYGLYQAKGGGLRYGSDPKKGLDCMFMNYPNGVQVVVFLNSTDAAFPLHPKLRDAFDESWE